MIALEALLRLMGCLDEQIETQLTTGQQDISALGPSAIAREKLAVFLIVSIC